MTTTGKALHVVSLEAENVKRLKAVRITPEGNMVVIGGNNAQGKSSVLDAIMMALAGKSSHCEEPIRKGAKKASATVDLGDYVVRRTWTNKGSYLKVETKEGMQAGSGQALLDAMLGKLTVDPLAFIRMDPKTQAAVVRDAIGIDTADADRKRKQIEEERRDIGRELKQWQGVVDSIQLEFDVYQRIDTADILEEVETDNRRRQELSDLEKQRDDAVQLEERTLREIEATERAIKELQEELARKIEKVRVARQIRPTLEQQINDAKLNLGDPTDIRARLAEAEKHNKAYDQWLKREEAKQNAKKAKELYDRCTRDMLEIDERKEATLAAAKWPVEGMGLNEEGHLTFQGVPLSQASQAEQLRTSIAMAMSQKPKLRILLVRDGSVLDANGMALVASIAEEFDAQVWIERVGQGAECQVIIEDGEIQEGETDAGSGTESGESEAFRLRSS